MFPCRKGAPASLHPLAVVIYAGAAGIMALLLTNPLYLVALSGAVLLAVARARAVPKLREYLAFMLPLLLLIVLLNGLLSGEGATVILRIPRLPLIGGGAVTLEALLYGLNMAFRLALILAVFCLYDSLQDTDATFSFLARFAFRSVFAVTVSALMVPRMKRDLVRIGAAMRKRGVSLSSGSLVSRLRAAFPIAKVLLISSLEGSWDTAESMHCRAFGSGPRSVYRRRGMGGRDWMVIAASLFSLCGFVVGAAMGRGFVSFYPSIGRLFEPSDTIFLAWILSGFTAISLWAWAQEKWRSIRSGT